MARNIEELTNTEYQKPLTNESAQSTIAVPAKITIKALLCCQIEVQCNNRLDGIQLLKLDIKPFDWIKISKVG